MPESIMNNVVIFNDSTTNPVTNGIVRNLSKYLINDSVFIYDEKIQSDLNYLSKSKDSKIYEGVLDFCEKEKITYLFISFLYYPEYLLAELNRRRKLNFKISFPMDWRVMTLSETRKYVMGQLAENKNISKILIHVAIPTNKIFNETKKIFNETKKIFEVYDPIYHEAELINREEALEKLGLDPNKFWLLFFGNMFYGKGLDILIEAMKDKKIKEKNINLLIGSSPERLNFDLDINKVKQISNITFNDFHIPEEEVKYYFSGADVIVLPYRKSYKNGSSAVFIQACQYDKPVIAPDIFPFNKITKQYKTGKLFEPNSCQSLINAIFLISENPVFENKRKDYIQTIQSWHTYIQNIF